MRPNHGGGIGLHRWIAPLVFVCVLATLYVFLYLQLFPASHWDFMLWLSSQAATLGSMDLLRRRAYGVDGRSDWLGVAVCWLAVVAFVVVRSLI